MLRATRSVRVKPRGGQAQPVGRLLGERARLGQQRQRDA